MRRVALALLATILAFPAAQAADLPAPLPEPANWNFTVFGGATWAEGVDTENGALNIEIDFDTGLLIGGAMGFTFVDWARTEVEVAYSRHDVDSARISVDGFPGGDTINNVDASVDVLTVMGNMWFGFNMLPLVGNPVNDIGSGLGLSPYFGGGLGVGFVDINGDSAELVGLDDDTTGLAWQVGAGIRWNFVSNLGLDLGYRYRNVMDVGMGDWENVDGASHNVTLGVVFNF